MPVTFGSSHQKRQSTSRLYIGLLVVMTIAVITFAVVAVRAVSPSQSAPVNTLTHGLNP